VSLQAHDGLYLSVQPGSKGLLYAQSSTLGDPQRFILHKVGGSGASAGTSILPGDSIALEVHSGRYLGTDLQGRGAIRALRYVPAQAETFEYVAPEP
jgi:hypothetical protein